MIVQQLSWPCLESAPWEYCSAGTSHMGSLDLIAAEQLMLSRLEHSMLMMLCYLSAEEDRPTVSQQQEKTDRLELTWAAPNAHFPSPVVHMPLATFVCCSVAE